MKLHAHCKMNMFFKSVIQLHTYTSKFKENTQSLAFKLKFENNICSYWFCVFFVLFVAILHEIIAQNKLFDHKY